METDYGRFRAVSIGVPLISIVSKPPLGAAQNPKFQNERKMKESK